MTHKPASAMWMFLAAAFFCPTLPMSSSAWSEEDVTGTWDLTVETSQGRGTPSINLKQDGERLSGTYKGRMGESPLQGTLRGNSIKFSVTLRFQNQDFVIAYAGTVDGDSMKGTVQFGDAGSGTWTARRKPSFN